MSCAWQGITVELWVQPASAEVCKAVTGSTEAMEFGKGGQS